MCQYYFGAYKVECYSMTSRLGNCHMLVDPTDYNTDVALFCLGIFIFPLVKPKIPLTSLCHKEKKVSKKAQNNFKSIFVKWLKHMENDPACLS